MLCLHPQKMVNSHKGEIDESEKEWERIKEIWNINWDTVSRLYGFLEGAEIEQKKARKSFEVW